ncbi:hypothetical protein [Victivallis sp. Marseille-Q1083]|uniref:hypothetical protein n=1 Tax=Victivallis sp. Marseille-Q1083 TaxID=2717288 RepID=UPI00158CE9D8|nr:hypothetical protein [Victivallis sp. Marseille-Q1083]
MEKKKPRQIIVVLLEIVVFLVILVAFIFFLTKNNDVPNISRKNGNREIAKVLQDDDKVDKTWKIFSPNGDYYCRVEELKEQGEIISFGKLGQTKEVFLLRTERWANIEWSEQNRWFVLLDCNDGHVTDLYVYHITDNENSMVELVYASPERWMYDRHWSLETWNFEAGTISIKCEYGCEGKTEWREKYYTIPIFIPDA